MASLLAQELTLHPSLPPPSVKRLKCGDAFSGLIFDSSVEHMTELQGLNGVINVWSFDDTLPFVHSLEDEAVTYSEPMTEPPASYTIHRWTGVDQLHKAGLRGHGATVAVIDTGIDYRHEALGGCFGPKCKVIGGDDLIGTHAGSEPDNDPIDTHGHGTHVSGIIAGDGPLFTGVAPDARLLAYKVFADKSGSNCAYETLIQAACSAYINGADVINVSINGFNGFSDGPWARVASRLVEKGLVVVISAGNDGTDGPFLAGAGSNGLGVISVASISVNTNSTVSMDDESTQPQSSIFTSWGPTNELLIKPDVGAPGSEILSTHLNGTYEFSSGTSMASPYVAGIAALYIGAHGGRSIHGPSFGRWLSEKIIASGRSVLWNVEGPTVMASPLQVGTGLVDAVRVLNYTTHVSSTPMALQDLPTFRHSWTVNITNNANKIVKYTFTQESQAAFEIHLGKVGLGIEPLRGLKLIKMDPEIQLPPTTRVKPGETVSVPVKFSPPKNINDDFLPIYGGKVWVNGDNGESLCVSYAGSAYDSEKAFDTMFMAEPKLEHAQPSWSFNLTEDQTDFVGIVMTMAYPCLHFRWDIFEENWSEEEWHYPPEIGKHGYIGSVRGYRPTYDDILFAPTPSIVKKAEPFPRVRLKRGTHRFWWFGTMANGTMIRPGTYTMRVAALRPRGNPQLSDHWQIARLPTVTVDRFDQSKKDRLKKWKKMEKEEERRKKEEDKKMKKWRKNQEKKWKELRKEQKKKMRKMRKEQQKKEAERNKEVEDTKWAAWRA
ncbi:hypothetical protein CDD82_7793 [Ophiocordyceps australis]|uniref:Peptidase S8/S53 domain-containing protein n=1 Tax=Ophiocordyceps australis TaxID=1399860 RepID=A0A2C5YUN2_9HYPO|nr:hypothetical protein CDD82_7793 [Ophiocordyceps australis]